MSDCARRILLPLVILGMTVSVPAKPPKIMTVLKDKPVIAAMPDKATLVVYRSISVGFIIELENFIDKTFIGSTKGKSYFVTRVDPGEKMLTVRMKGKIFDGTKITLEAGKTYYFFESTFNASTAKNTDFEEEINGMDYFTLDTGKEMPQLSEEEYSESLNLYKENVLGKPDEHQDEINYKGY